MKYKVHERQLAEEAARGERGDREVGLVLLLNLDHHRARPDDVGLRARLALRQERRQSPHHGQQHAVVQHTTACDWWK